MTHIIVKPMHSSSPSESNNVYLIPNKILNILGIIINVPYNLQMYLFKKNCNCC